MFKGKRVVKHANSVEAEVHAYSVNKTFFCGFVGFADSYDETAA
jgi:hypothetical protein